MEIVSPGVLRDETLCSALDRTVGDEDVLADLLLSNWTVDVVVNGKVFQFLLVE
eukprot:CAMPEP_0185594488 /NCGR_PEP_ID=MMETSP0434-20130131/75089_1 /TAXON_ID=626734 ORGANISM="Favella taraikaensis, Strain Fe Narragansett Bay" /NCGR_SAMPLE_ID=MMETSP0434 /ASSEMBLY_ACC=CAM_ASM_000379 /LENGTH=53 /DNA_ID=CAMNT_0028221857 /DNA_START=57 /DNA_END=218 /DNA_ORIENTATION=-